MFDPFLRNGRVLLKETLGDLATDGIVNGRTVYCSRKQWDIWPLIGLVNGRTVYCSMKQ